MRLIYLALRKLSFLTHLLSKKLEWLSFKFYDRAEHRSAGRREKGRIF